MLEFEGATNCLNKSLNRQGSCFMRLITGKASQMSWAPPSFFHHYTLRFRQIQSQFWQIQPEMSYKFPLSQMFCENLVLLILTEGMWFTAVKITVAFLGNHFFYNCVCSNEIIICVFSASDTFCPRGLCMFKTVSVFSHATPTVYFRHNKAIHSAAFSRKPNFSLIPQWSSHTQKGCCHFVSFQDQCTSSQAPAPTPVSADIADASFCFRVERR